MVALLIAGLLFVEYRFFKSETEKMLALKEDYRNHLLAVNKVLQDYNKNKERLEALEALTPEKKNSLLNVDAVCSQVFPKGARVVSSDDELSGEDESFIPINRDLEYLKQSTIDYIKKKNMNFVLQQINFDEWRDYTEHVKAQQIRTQGGKKKRRSRSKRVASARMRTLRMRPHEYEQEAKEMSFGWPIERSNFWLSSFFGPRRKPDGSRGFHYGIDMAAVRGTPVRASAGGTVIEARQAPGYGKTVVVSHNRKYRTRYAHLNTISVKVGQTVYKGELIGKVGATGSVRSKRGKDASHLHFEVYAFGKQVNPMYFLA